MSKGTRISVLDQPLFKIFLNLKDSRVAGRCLHPFINIIFITLCALIAGSDGWKSIENFGREKTRWLSQFINLENGIPSHLTFARVIARINPKLFEYCAREWFQLIYQLEMWDIIHFDGKTACGSGHVNGNKKNMHLVNAYFSKYNVILGSERVKSKSNEVKAIPILLNELNISGVPLSQWMQWVLKEK